MNSGTYLLLVEIERDIEVKIKRKEIKIKKGKYLYVGSAMKNLHQRVGRHISFKEGDYKKHWHIDSLLENGKVLFSIIIPDGIYKEEKFSKKFNNNFNSIKNFGATDLKTDSNLFIIENTKKFFEFLNEILV
ncbi:endonuclease [Tepiditoga spiralis]|uniref:Endonuclease n=1 Tax=Tepiditoga spiralis TaxID=2108365 RepID=A0A7G1G427_9BACT|nr:DUF123 domain-containing protein [Tepiditoga spiralis]BBE31228.1 endonuclease [Tepiditoga spiralis]